MDNPGNGRPGGGPCHDHPLSAAWKFVNAIRYAGDAGPIIVSAQPHGPQVVVSVVDNGPGVPPDALGRLFDPFFRPEASRSRDTGGSGLGLAIVKSCVEACGGTVRLKNCAPHGLQLEITLPRAA